MIPAHIYFLADMLKNICIITIRLNQTKIGI